MAAMTTALTDYTHSSNGNSRTFTLSGHTALKPKIVIQKRKTLEGNNTMAEASFAVIMATEDVDGVVLSQKPSVELKVRYPANGTYSDVTAAHAVALDILGGDEWGVVMASLGWLPTS
jgi:hypothetical protein